MLRRALSSTATRVGLIIMLLLATPAAGLGVAAQGEEPSESNTQLVLVLEATPLYGASGEPVGEAQPGETYVLVSIEDDIAVVVSENDPDALLSIELDARVEVVQLEEREEGELPLAAPAAESPLQRVTPGPSAAPVVATPTASAPIVSSTPTAPAITPTRQAPTPPPSAQNRNPASWSLRPTEIGRASCRERV